MKVQQQKYPQLRRARVVAPDAVFADFCVRHARRILCAKDLPPSVHELLENGRGRCHIDAGKAGLTLLTHRECPQLLQNGQLLLWPEDEPMPDDTLAGLPEAPAYNPKDGRQFVPDQVLSQRQVSNVLFEGDCLAILPFFPTHSIDMILCDLPYGTTQNKWDSVIPLDKLWTQYMRILKPEGVVVLTAQGVFTAKVILGNEAWFKYKIVWEKSKPTNFLNAKKQPLRKHEDVCVFYRRQPVYHPEMWQGQPYDKGVRKNQLSGSYGDFLPARVRSSGDRYPTDVVYFKTAESEGPVWHPTQKPVELGRYLVRTYTDPGALVLDNAFGSGSFLVAAAQEGRRFVGIEQNQDVHLFKRVRIDYVGLARQRIEQACNLPQEAASADTSSPSRITSVEQRRCAVSRQTSGATKAQLGQFMTPSGIARYLASLFDKQQGGECILLDPGAGIGSLTDAFLKNASLCFVRVYVTACEIDARLAGDLAQTLGAAKAEIVQSDFIETAVNWLQFEPQKRFTHVIMNPPYRKIASSSAARLLLRQVDIETVNLYSAFVALCIKLLKKGGQLVAIVPRSFCNGPYYKPFRKLILAECAISHIHLFGSRKSAFKDDKVLQENVVIKLVKEVGQGTVDISLSTDDSFADYEMHTHAFSSIVAPDDLEVFIKIPTTEDQNRLDALSGANCALEDVGVSVSTGPVVDFRVKDHLRQNQEPGTVPLLYPAHCPMNFCAWPKTNGKKPNALVVDEQTRKALFPLGFYCVVKRFSSKEEKRRITASVVAPGPFKGHAAVAFENHLNVFHEAKTGIPEALAYGLAVYLNTSFVDNFFRRFNGHTQVNATDLRQLRYPSREKLILLGKWAMQQKDLTQVCMNDHVQEVLA